MSRLYSTSRTTTTTNVERTSVQQKRTGVYIRDDQVALYARFHLFFNRFVVPKRTYNLHRAQFTHSLMYETVNQLQHVPPRVRPDMAKPSTCRQPAFLLLLRLNTKLLNYLTFKFSSDGPCTDGSSLLMCNKCVISSLPLQCQRVRHVADCNSTYNQNNQLTL
jgi:hypothetical protein